MATSTVRSIPGNGAFPLRFVVIAFTFTWAFWWPAALAERGMISLPVPTGLLVVPGTLGPILAAIALVAAEEGGSGVRSLLGRVFQARVAPIWWAVVALVPFLMVLTAIGFHVLLGGETATPMELIEYLPTVLVQTVYMVLFVALGEEVGWRGYALPTLQGRYNAFWSSVVVALIWAAWHLPLFFNPAMHYSRLPFLIFVAYLVPFSILLTWVYNSTRGSLLLVIVFHAVVNATGALWLAVPDLARLGPVSPAEVTTRANSLMAVAVAVVAIVILVATGPRDLSRQRRQLREMEEVQSAPR